MKPRTDPRHRPRFLRHRNGGRNSRLGYLLLMPLLLFGKSYHYSEIKTEVRLAADGSARIVQDRTYVFDGSFTWAFVDLKKQGSESVIFDGLYQQTATGWERMQPEEVTDRGMSLYIKWTYSAQNQARTFRLAYTVKGATRRYQDVAEFYWKVIEDEHERIDLTHTAIFLPARAPELFKIYVHANARPGKLTFNEAMDQANIEQSGIPSNTFVEIRLLAAPAIFPQVSLTASARYQEILNQERSNFLAASLRRHVLAPLGLVLIVILPLILLILLYGRFGREPKLSYDVTYEHEPPRPAPPVAVPAILHQQPGTKSMYQFTFQGMFATLLDLARRGLVSVRETTKHHYEFRLEKPEQVAQLDPFSRETVRFFFEQVATEPNVLTDKALEKYVSSRAQALGIQAMLKGLFEQAKAWWTNELGSSLLDAISTRAYWAYNVSALLLIGLGVVVLHWGVMGIVYQKELSWIVAGAVGIIPLVVFGLLGRTILRWSKPAFLEHRRWKAFRKFLKDFSAIEQAPVQLLAIWEQYYVYAAALGVAHEFLKNVTKLSEKQGMPLALPVWYVASAGSGAASLASLGEGLAGFQNFASNMSSMMSSFSTATSSGGGFSGGGGGGGGGGSSGAG